MARSLDHLQWGCELMARRSRSRVVQGNAGDAVAVGATTESEPEVAEVPSALPLFGPRAPLLGLAYVGSYQGTCPPLSLVLGSKTESSH